MIDRVQKAIDTSYAVYQGAINQGRAEGVETGRRESGVEISRNALARVRRQITAYCAGLGMQNTLRFLGAGCFG